MYLFDYIALLLIVEDFVLFGYSIAKVNVDIGRYKKIFFLQSDLVKQINTHLRRFFPQILIPEHVSIGIKYI